MWMPRRRASEPRLCRRRSPRKRVGFWQWCKRAHLSLTVAKRHSSNTSMDGLSFCLFFFCQTHDSFKESMNRGYLWKPRAFRVMLRAFTASWATWELLGEKNNTLRCLPTVFQCGLGRKGGTYIWTRAGTILGFAEEEKSKNVLWQQHGTMLAYDCQYHGISMVLHGHFSKNTMELPWCMSKNMFYFKIHVQNPYNARVL